MTIGVFFCVAVMIVILYLTNLANKRFEDAMVSHTQQELLTIAEATAVSIEEFIYENLDDLLLLSRYQLLQEQRDDYPFLDTFSESKKPDFDAVYLLDSTGTVLYRNPTKKDIIGTNYAHRPDVIFTLTEHIPYEPRSKERNQQSKGEAHELTSIFITTRKTAQGRKN